MNSLLDVDDEKMAGLSELPELNEVSSGTHEQEAYWNLSSLVHSAAIRFLIPDPQNDPVDDGL
jgi:hypothetical protein